METLQDYSLDNTGVTQAVREVLRYLMVDVDRYSDQALLTFWEGTSVEEKKVLITGNTRVKIMKILADEKSLNGDFDEHLVRQFRQAFETFVEANLDL
jgi:hypothetical protein